MQWLDDRETMQGLIRCALGFMLLLGANVAMLSGPEWTKAYLALGAFTGVILIYIEFENYRRRRRPRD